MTSADVAKLFGVVPATVRQWERLGRIPAHRTSTGMRLFARADVMRVFEEWERAKPNGPTAWTWQPPAETGA